MLIQALKLNDPSMIAAAEGRAESWKLRTALALVYAISGALATNAFLFPGVWFIALSLSMTIDYQLGDWYLAARTDAQRTHRGAWFMAFVALTQLGFVSMTVWVGVEGGGTGRAVSMLMAAGSIATSTIFLMNASSFMLITLVPTALWLLVSPFIPIADKPLLEVESIFALSFATLGFFAYTARSIVNNASLLKGLQSANERAQQRQVEAEEKQAEAEEANRTKSEFLTTMTHELRTPLNAVIGYSEIIGEDMEAEGFKDLAKDAKRITAAARHLLGLIDQILQLTHIDAGRSALELDEIEVRGLIEGAVASVTEMAHTNRNRLATRIASDVAVAQTDGEKLGLCVRHLLSNAVKFTNNGLVAISAEREQANGREWLRIAVSDTGVGMTAEEINKAFQPFTQLDGSKTRAQGGLGLGLSITARTAKVLGGEVWASSEPGAGSTFTLRVPMRFAQSERPGAPAPRFGAAA
ncbi:MAG TPA: HAMP domain-containing sensor histidine kinase [Caulobacterales bacterium]|nr:HAMP domain-containing sensor histidine kinase [Caulobacterales bacterium]